jgi:beta-glucanase (GH16 family)
MKILLDNLLRFHPNQPGRALVAVLAAVLSLVKRPSSHLLSPWYRSGYALIAGLVVTFGLGLFYNQTLRMIYFEVVFLPFLGKSPPLEYLECQWNSIFLEDNFSEDLLDLGKWQPYPHWGRVDPKGEEEQFYHDDAFEFKDGILRIRADKQNLGGKNYTSGLIQALPSYAFTHGCLEVRLRVPKGKGFWTSVWLYPLSNEWPPEIDIIESLGHESEIAYLSHHWKSPTGEHETYTESFIGQDFSDDFHTFTVNWSSKRIIWFIDEIERHRTETGVPQEPMFLIINLAVGGDWPGSPDETTSFPSYMEIDYVRISR